MVELGCQSVCQLWTWDQLTTTVTSRQHNTP